MAPPADLYARLESSAFGWLGPEARAHIARTSHIRRLPTGRVVFRHGDAPDGCYLVLQGAVKVSLPADGRETLLAILGKGDVVGEMALLDRLPRSATVTALNGCELCHLPTVTFDHLTGTDRALHQELLRQLSTRLRVHNERHALQRMALSARLAGALLQLARSCGEQLPDRRVLIRQRISQADLGQMIGAARENVNRQLAEWLKSRLLSRIGGYYCLNNPSALEPLARDSAS